MSKKIIIVVDTETGGLDPGLHSLLTVGLVATTAPVFEAEDQLILRLQHPSYVVTAEAMRVNGLDLADEEGAITVPDAAWRIEEFLWKHGGMPAVLGGHNIPFDLAFLRSAFGREQVDQWFSRRYVDTMPILRFLSETGALPEDLGGSLDDACRCLGIERPQPHHALADAQATVKVLRGLASLVQPGGE